MNVTVELVTPETYDEVQHYLASLLVDTVDDGASVGFVGRLDPDEASLWWAESLRSPTLLTFVARDTARVPVGVVQLKLATTMNALHRADVCKLLIHTSARRRGVGDALLGALETEARQRGCWLLLLDTETGSDAERFYVRRGWRVVGVIDDYALAPDGQLRATTVLTKRLPP